jgi:sphingolipid delta-4 desaturase
MERRAIDFAYSSTDAPHRDRAQAILQAHPDVRRYVERNRVSLVVILTLVGLQVSLAAYVQGLGWWAVCLLAYLVGAFANHALLVMVHECAHNLVFQRRVLNVLAGMLAGLPSILLNSVAWSTYHLKHHAYQGSYARDFDLPSRWEARLIGHSAVTKALWLLLFALVLSTRPLRGQREFRRLGRNRWVLLNISAQLAFGLSVGVLIGGKAVGYLLASLFFSIGLHPLGGRWIQEHYLTAKGQDTYSYYGPLNRLAFNVGYHNEHHDFPGVPWNNLSRLRRLAPEAYDTLVWHPSWTALVLRFVLDRDLGLFHRMVRIEEESSVTRPGSGASELRY